MALFLSDFHFDFAVALTVLALVTGIGWALDRWWLAPARVQRGADPEKGGPFIDFCNFAFPVIFVVLILRSFLFEPFRIPSGSMIPTLLVGDFILVNKFAYGIRTPVGFYKVFDVAEPQRGDVAVFRFPADPSKDYIKRIVGLPGDRVEYRNKQLFINGQAQDLEAAGIYSATASGRAFVVQRYTETIGDEVEHPIIVNPSVPAEDFAITVPEGRYFGMGDNLDGSLDSRSWGTLPERNLVGKAVLIWMSWDGARNRIDWGRIGDAIE